MTVNELIEMLQSCDPEMEVKIAQPTHNHWRQVVAAQVGEVAVTPVKYSEYNRDDIVTDDDECEYDEETGEEIEGNTRKVLLIS